MFHSAFADGDDSRRRHVRKLLGRAVQVDPIKLTLKPLGNERLKLKSDVLLSILAFDFNSRRYFLVFIIPPWTLPLSRAMLGRAVQVTLVAPTPAY